MTDEQLREIESRAAAATPAPWQYANTVDLVSAVIADDGSVCEFYGLQDRIDKDAAFIVAAREDVPALAAELRVARAALDAFKPFMKWAAGHLAAQDIERPDDRIVYAFNDSPITLGDMRAAVAVMEWRQFNEDRREDDK